MAEETYRLTLKGLVMSEFDCDDEKATDFCEKLELYAYRIGYKVPAIVCENSIWSFVEVEGGKDE